MTVNANVDVTSKHLLMLDEEDGQAMNLEPLKGLWIVSLMKPLMVLSQKKKKKKIFLKGCGFAFQSSCLL